ncbi:MAG: serine hydrolase [Myxococcota bacterium]
MKFLAPLVLTFIVVLPTARGQSSGEPCNAPVPLENRNPTLQRELETRMREKGWGRLMDKQALAVSLVDLTRRNRRYYAGVNDDKMLYAASLPKIAILLSVIEAVEQGNLEWTFEFDRRLQNMIVASSNTDASWGVDIVGLLSIEKTMRSPRYCFYNEPEGGLWVGRPYRRGGASNRDPLYNISHGSTSRQAARFYTMLDAGQLVSKHWSFRMLGLMSPPKHFHKFVGGLSKEPGVVFLARKSGTWRTFHADSALIQAHGHRYVLVGLSDTKNGEGIMRELAKMAHDIVTEGKHRKPKRRTRRRRNARR